MLAQIWPFGGIVGPLAAGVLLVVVFVAVMVLLGAGHWSTPDNREGPAHRRRPAHQYAEPADSERHAPAGPGTRGRSRHMGPGGSAV